MCWTSADRNVEIQLDIQELDNLKIENDILQSKDFEHKFISSNLFSYIQVKLGEMAFRFWLVVRPAHLFSSKFHNKISLTKNERNRKLNGLRFKIFREIFEILYSWDTAKWNDFVLFNPEFQNTHKCALRVLNRANYIRQSHFSMKFYLLFSKELRALPPLRWNISCE